MNPSTKQWLGGKADGRWSNHYELLGLPLGFADSATIARIANELLHRIQSAAQHEATPQLQMLDRAVSQAKNCLTDEALKLAYDAQLATTDSTNITNTTSASDTFKETPFTEIPFAEIPFAEIPEAVPIGTPVSTSTQPPPSFTTNRKSPSLRQEMRRQKRSRFWLTVGSVLLGAGCFGGLALLGKFFLFGESQQVVVTENRPTEANSLAPPAITTPAEDPNSDAMSSAPPVTTSSETVANGVAEPSLQPQSEVAHTNDTRETSVVSPPANSTIKPLSDQELLSLAGSLANVRTALEKRDFPGANRSLIDAANIAQHPQHVRLVEELAELTHYTEEYWAGFDDAWSSLSAGNEIVVGTTRVSIIDIIQDLISLRVAGAKKSYNRNELPAGLQRAIMDSWLDQNAASSSLIVGAYHATKIPPDTDEARRAWQTAKQRGAESDLLMSTLDATYDVEHLRQQQTTP